MKKGFKIVIIILFLLVVGLVTYIIADKVVNKQQEVNNTATVANNTDNGATTVNSTTNNTTKENNAVANTTDSKKNESKEDAKKIELSDDEVLDILLTSKTFNEVSNLSNQDKLEIVYHALNEKKIKAYSNRKSMPNNSAAVEYTKEEINGIVYSLFGVKLDKIESWGEALVYKDGKYVLYYSDGGGDIYTAKNVERDAAAGTSYTTYDLYYSDMGDTPVNKGRYVIARSGVTSFVTSKKLAE